MILLALAAGVVIGMGIVVLILIAARWRAAQRPMRLLRTALREVPSLQCAILFGSTAAGTDSPSSDIDVLTISEVPLPAAAIVRLCDVSLILGRSVTPVQYSLREVADRLREDSHFMRNVFAAPKVLLAGSEQGLIDLAGTQWYYLPSGKGARRA